MMEKSVGLFDGLIGGMVGAEMVTVVNRLIEKHGGVEGVVSQLQSGGLGPTVRAWIAEGQNEPVSAGEVHKAFGDETINELALKAGMSPQELAEKLATVLPHVVNQASPGGSLPKS